MDIAMISAQASPLDGADGEVPGAQSAHVSALSAALARAGHAVSVYTRRNNSDLPDTVESPDGYRVVHVPAGPAKRLTSDELVGAMGPFARYLATLWKKSGPDITHAHFWLSGLATELAARQLNLPTVVRFHGLGANGTRRRLESILAKAATAISAGCAEEAFQLIRMGTPRAGTSVIPYGVDVERFTPVGPKAARDGNPLLISVGKLLPDNGFDFVIRALPLIPDAEFVIIGDAASGDLRSDGEACRLRELAESLGVADRVSLHGKAAADELPALLRSADVVACTPSYESSGAVALQAMASGVPVVARAVGALPDAVVHDVTGYLIGERDPKGFVTSVNSLLRDSFLRQSLGSAGRDRVVARYNWDRIAADTARLYGRSMTSRHVGKTAALV